MPARHETFCDGGTFVDLPLWDCWPVNTAGRLRDIGQRHHRGARQLGAGGLIVDVQQWCIAPDGRQHGQTGLDVHPNIAGVDRQWERFGGGQSIAEPSVDK